MSSTQAKTYDAAPSTRVAFIGLGVMGYPMAGHLALAGHSVTVYNRNAAKSQAWCQEYAATTGPRSAATPREAAQGADMVFCCVGNDNDLRSVILGPDGALAGMKAGAVLVDHTTASADVAREIYAAAKNLGIHFIDAGTSGGVWGLENGYCMMVGGDEAPVKEMEPTFLTLAPKDGYMHCGATGAGHYVKMVHNGIEYGLMQAYAEGFEILAKSRYQVDLAKVSDLWMQGSVVRSWLLELAGRAFRAEGNELKSIKGWVADSGEGRWTVQEAIDLDVPAPLITLSLLTRFRSRQEDSYSAKVLAALRNQFGGHAVKPE